MPTDGFRMAKIHPGHYAPPPRVITSFQSLYEIGLKSCSIIDEQKWKLESGILKNKKGASFWHTNSTWMIDDEETVVDTDGETIKTFLIENVSKAKWLTKTGKLTFNKNKAQIWKEVNKDDDGFFTLEVYPATTTPLARSAANQVLTASPNQLTLEGW